MGPIKTNLWRYFRFFCIEMNKILCTDSLTCRICLILSSQGYCDYFIIWFHCLIPDIRNLFEVKVVYASGKVSLYSLWESWRPIFGQEVWGIYFFLYCFYLPLILQLYRFRESTEDNEELNICITSHVVGGITFTSKDLYLTKFYSQIFFFVVVFYRI